MSYTTLLNSTQKQLVNIAILLGLLLTNSDALGRHATAPAKPIYAQTKQLEQQTLKHAKQVQTLTKKYIAISANIVNLTAKQAKRNARDSQAKRRISPADLMRIAAKDQQYQHQLAQLRQTLILTKQQLECAQLQQKAWAYKVFVAKKAEAILLAQEQDRFNAAKKRRLR